MGYIFYMGLGIIVHLIFWGGQWFGLSSLALIIFWPVYLFFVIGFWALLVVLVIAGAAFLLDKMGVNLF